MKFWAMFAAFILGGAVTVFAINGAVPSSAAQSCEDWAFDTADRVSIARQLVYPFERQTQSTGSLQGDAQALFDLAARWDDHRKVPQVAFKPDWTKHAKAAPFKRNDQILEVLPIGAMVFPGTGIQGNLADKARKLGIPVWKFGGA